MAQKRKVALITGSGRNIGRAVALGLAEDGFDIVLNGSSDRAACEAVAGEAEALGAATLVALGDVGQAADCARIVAEAMARFGQVDVLVNNAAIRPAMPFLETPEETWRRVLAVDLEAARWLARDCLPGMLARRWGRIVNFTGMNAIQGYDGHATVSVAKHGVWGLTKALAKEFGPQGVTVNAISPGPTAKDGQDTASGPGAVLARIPLGRLGTPAEVAVLVRTLASEAGAFINGQMLQVNGGTQT
ncbi:3-oxoacyl-ACP reductase [Pseudoroseomonas rhizosphaerae]|uniref:3-oxoacyl-ACP reductase n=1 Tax=Teichococcus rhizosphaerae TaxID=1335062 RepID=A0A2C7ACV0_9PROT|nr:SDR family oxidoreductase [Pseudoroseomonas rhizosphaerae]PHK95265.1 3-oxoacyl-ACP reductase [Pseudoroseomonas rhizosphaerae]